MSIVSIAESQEDWGCHRRDIEWYRNKSTVANKPISIKHKSAAPWNVLTAIFYAIIGYVVCVCLCKLVLGLYFVDQSRFYVNYT